MVEDIKTLIDKIHQDGVEAAQAKARDIQQQAEGKANAIVQQAKAQADKIVREARDRVAKTEESSKISLKQAARDLLIALRKEINAMLDKLLLSDMRTSLDTDALLKIITKLIADYKEKEGLEVSLSKDDQKKIEKHFLAKLKQGLKKAVTLKSSQDITGGLVISYDAGKSHYDFTDKALAAYLASFVNHKLAEILKESVSK